MALLTSAAGAVLLLLLASTLYSLACLLRNYLVARKIGVPVRIIPVDHINPLWLLVSQRVVSVLRRLPSWLGDNNITKYDYLGFEIPIRWSSHAEMGDAFVLCTPSRNWLYIGNPEVITAMLKRPNDFPHDSQLTAMLDVFGPNISTVRGEPGLRIYLGAEMNNQAEFGVLTIEFVGPRSRLEENAQANGLLFYRPEFRDCLAREHCPGKRYGPVLELSASG